MNSDGRIFLQKRSRIKEENTGMFDKTIGGHIVAEDSEHMTVLKECAEEL
jgi:isopentenyldiphosphate isomerase